MQSLTRIVLVNWYRFQAREIPIRGDTVIVGPNGSGKSALIDAIQTVLFGGHGHHLNLNAGAQNERSSGSHRSLVDYCLGKVRTPGQPEELAAGSKPRRTAITHIALVFENDQRMETSVGVAMHASEGKSHADVDARYTVVGAGVRLEDLVEDTGEGLSPRTWDQVRPKIEARAQDVRKASGAEAYMRQVAWALNDHSEERYSADWFARNFKNAIAFHPIENVSEFVRNFVLEEDSIEVDALQESLRNYMEIEEKTRQVEDRIERLERVGELYAAATEFEEHGAALRLVQAMADKRAEEDELAPLEEAFSDHEERLEGLRSEKEAYAAKDKQFEERKAKLEARINNADVTVRKSQIQAKRTTQTENWKGADRQIEGIRGALGKLSSVFDMLRDRLGATDASALERLADVAPGEGLGIDNWPPDPGAVDEVLGAVSERMDEILSSVRDSSYAEWERGKAASDRAKDRKRRILEIEAGRSDVSGETAALRELLEAEGITSTPVSDLVEVSERRWQETVEAYLGGNREALVVASEQAEQAIRIYRNAVGGHRAPDGAKVLNTRRIGEWARRPTEGSLAEVVKVADHHARSYIDFQLGGVRRVETEDELLEHKRAATPDRMLASGGTVTRMKAKEPMLGITAEDRVERLKAEFEEADREERAARSAQEGFDKARQILERLAERLGEGVSVAGAVRERTEAEEALTQLDREEEALDTSEIDEAESELAELKKHRERASVEAKEVDQRIEKEVGEQATVRTKIGNINEEIDRLEDQRRQWAEHPLVDPDQALKLFHQLEREVETAEDGANPVEISARAKNRSYNAFRQATGQNGRKGALHELREYWQHYGSAADLAGTGVDLNDLEDYENREMAGAAESFVRAEKVRLVDTSLADYRERAQEAKEEAEQSFRSHFLGRLQGKFDEMSQNLNQLNRSLSNQPFHGRKYRFNREQSADRDCQAILKLLREGVGDGLFAPDQIGDDEAREAMEQVRQILESASEDEGRVKRLKDYRNYFRFDVKMMDEANPNSFEWLSQRLGSGSGGESQVPFYVAIGSALVSAYRIRRESDGRLSSALRLGVFDEAFDKLDQDNARAALEFFKQVGLQTMVAAPDEKRPVLAGQMDTVIEIAKDRNDVVQLTVQHLNESGKRILMDGLPERPG